MNHLEQAHVDDSYVVSVRCSRFEQRKKCACEDERAQVAKGERKKVLRTVCKYHILYCHVILDAILVHGGISKVGDSNIESMISRHGARDNKKTYNAALLTG